MTHLIPYTISAFLGAVLLSACSSEEKQQEAHLAKPLSVTIAKPSLHTGGSINVSGQVEAAETANISTRLMGLVSKIHVRVGDQVAKGQLLVSIHNDDVIAKKAQAGAMLGQAQAALLNAEKDLQRFTALHQQQSASDKELENITLHYQATKAQAEAAKQMQNEVNATLTYTNLTAPFAGVITRQLLDAGNIAVPGTAILSMEKSQNLQVNASLPEIDIDKVKKGMPAHLLVKSTGKNYQGTLTEVSASSQATGGQYRIKVSIEIPDTHGLFAGMYVQVSIPLAEGNKEKIMVPLSSIIYKDQMTGIYTIGPNQSAMLRWVRLGKKSDSEIEVLSGLSGNEEFIVYAEGRLYNGAPVIIKTN